MRHLILYAHFNPASFTAAIRDRIATALQHCGHEVEVRDLYAQGYNPLIQASDFEDFFAGRLPADILAEQEAVAAANVVHFVFPLWWAGFPAILKGWIDRTFLPGFAYMWENGERNGLLSPRRAMLWTPQGNTHEEYTRNGQYDAIDNTCRIGILGYIGIEIIDHVYFSSIRQTTGDQRTQWLEEVSERIAKEFCQPA